MYTNSLLCPVHEVRLEYTPRRWRGLKRTNRRTVVADSGCEPCEHESRSKMADHGNQRRKRNIPNPALTRSSLLVHLFLSSLSTSSFLFRLSLSLPPGVAGKTHPLLEQPTLPWARAFPQPSVFTTTSSALLPPPP